MGFRLLSEFSHFLFLVNSLFISCFVYAFPSPFGVLSFLIMKIIFYYKKKKLLGFRLLSEFSHFLCNLQQHYQSTLTVIVSVSFRSSLISYSKKKEMVNKKNKKVSVSFRSSLISYMPNGNFIDMSILESFRLLSEFSHFLLEVVKMLSVKNIRGFRLLSEFSHFL